MISMTSRPSRHPGVSWLLLVIAAVLAGRTCGEPTPGLVEGWEDPPVQARLRAYWWWLNGNVTSNAITRDLEAMRTQGFGGALICDAGGAEQRGNAQVRHGPTFLTPAWRALYRHALREAARLGLEMSLNIQSGWNIGGPVVPVEDAAKRLTWSEVRVAGPTNLVLPLPTPRHRDGFYRDLFVVAYPLPAPAPSAAPPPARRPLQLWEQKAMHKTMPFASMDTLPLLRELAPEPGEEDTRAAAVLDLSARLDTDGVLRWEVPAGAWQVLRFGATVGDHAYVSTSSEGWGGYTLDPCDAGAFERYWDRVVEPLLDDARPWLGTTLKYLHTDSWEMEPINWTPTLPGEFHRRRGYDLRPFLPVLAGRIVESRTASQRFLNDFRRTFGDLTIDHHYRVFAARAHARGLGIHPESGGPHMVPIDAQQCLGMNDVPMSEFWARSWTHRTTDATRFFLKQPASAAHTYGRRLVAAEGFTTIGPHWQETLWDNLKPAFDQALCDGLNLLFWHAVVCSPEEEGLPGIQYFAGTHFNPNTTWWSRSGPFLAYLNRCQWLLQQGTFVADACFYYGSHVPNLALLKNADQAGVLPGYDYDVISADALIGRLAARDGRLVLPDGLSYRVLVLPDRPAIARPVLHHVRALVHAGATVLGPRPTEELTLADYPACDAEVQRLAAELWGPPGAPPAGERTVGAGRVIWGRSARAVLAADGVPPDFEVLEARADAKIDYLHRTAGHADIYFVANRSNRWETVRAAFRVTGKAPELWDAVSGQRRFAAAYEPGHGRTTLPLELPPCGSTFVVFREPASAHPPVPATDRPAHDAPPDRIDLRGPWTVRFDPRWGGPAAVTFDALVSWTARPEPGIKYYAGTATYTTAFRVPGAWGVAADGGRGRLWLDLGSVRELAEVRLNGTPLGVVWAPPFRVDITASANAGENRLEVDVVNFWPNRIVGDQFLPPHERYTRTNIRQLTRDTPLMESGLLGPVRLEWVPGGEWAR